MKERKLQGWMIGGIIGFGVFLFLLTFFVHASEGTPIIKLMKPLNNTINLDGKVSFAYNITDSVTEIDICSLIFDGTINQSNSNINKSLIQYFILSNLSNGDHYWSINCTSEEGEIISSGIWKIKIFIDTTAPSIILNGPQDESIDTDGNVIFNYTVIDDGWVTSCSLYTDMSGTWQKNQTNTFVQENVSLYFELDNIPDDSIFKWNVICYDFALSPNFAWAYVNQTIIINNNAPTYSTIPNQEWYEDNTHTINLSNYFSDIDGDILTYSSTSLTNIDISIDNSTGIVILKPDLNWNGQEEIIFYAFDIMGQKATSNTVTLTVNHASDDPPQIISAFPLNKSTDTDGFVFINCSAFDDYSLSNISLYTNIGGVWKENQSKNVTGNYDSVLFNLTDLSDGSYEWSCRVSDNASQVAWGDHRMFNVYITAEIEHNIPDFIVNDVNTSRWVVITYSSYLNNLLTLGNLTIYSSNGDIYFTKNMSDSSNSELKTDNTPLIVHGEKIRVIPHDFFYEDFSIGNQEWINITQKYSYKEMNYQTSIKHAIEIKPPLPTPPE